MPDGDPILPEKTEGYVSFDNQGVWQQYNARREDQPLVTPSGEMNPNAYYDTDGNGWKIHVSAQTPEAAKALAELGAEYKIPVFKVANSEAAIGKLQADSQQAGKVAVFYYAENGADGKPIDWQGFLQDAQNTLDRNGGAGAAVQRDRALAGSDGIYYRNDLNAEGQYQQRAGLTDYMRNNAIDDGQAYNLGGREDPLQGIELTSQRTMNVPGYDKIPRDGWQVVTDGRSEGAVRLRMASLEDAQAMVDTLNENGVSAQLARKPMRGGGEAAFVQVNKEGTEAFSQLRDRQAQAATKGMSASPRPPTPDEIGEFFVRAEAEKAAGQAAAATEKPITDTLQPIPPEEAAAMIDKKMAARAEARAQSGISDATDNDGPNKTSRGVAAGTSKLSNATNVASGATGVALGTVGLVNSIERGDAAGIAVAGTNLATGTAQSAAEIAGSAGRAFSTGLRSGIAKANIAATVIDGIYQITQEEGAGNKLQRGGAVTATTLAAVGTTTALSGGLTIGGAAATGTAATVTSVAAPVVLPVAAALTVGYAADTAIETSRTYDKIDQQFLPTKDYDNIRGVIGDDRIAARLEELGATKDERGYFEFTDKNNVYKLQKAITEEKRRYEGIMEQNDSSLPRWIKFTDKQIEAQSAYENAKFRLRRLESAQAELPGYIVTAEAEEFNERTRPELIAQLNANPEYLRDGMTAEEMVPMLDTGAAIQAQVPAGQNPEGFKDAQRNFAPILRENNNKIETLQQRLEVIRQQAALAGQTQDMAGQDQSQLAAFKQTDEYRFAMFKIENNEKMIEGTRAAEKQLGYEVDTDEKAEANVLAIKADLMAKQKEFMETGQITPNKFSPMLDALLPDEPKPARTEMREQTAPQIDAANITAAPSKRPEDLAAALEKSGFTNTLGGLAALDMQDKQTGELQASTASNGQQNQGDRGLV